MTAVLAAAPSWGATIAVCAVLLPIAIGLSIQMLRDLGDAPATDGGERSSRPPLPLVVFAGVPVAVVSIEAFLRVAHRDYRLEGKEVAVLCAATGAILLLIAVDLVRSGRRRLGYADERT